MTQPVPMSCCTPCPILRRRWSLRSNLVALRRSEVWRVHEAAKFCAYRTASWHWPYLLWSTPALVLSRSRPNRAPPSCQAIVGIQRVEAGLPGVFNGEGFRSQNCCATSYGHTRHVLLPHAHCSRPPKLLHEKRTVYRATRLDTAFSSCRWYLGSTFEARFRVIQ